MTTIQIILSLALAGFVLFRHLAGGLLCVSPALMRVRRAPEGALDGEETFLGMVEAELKPLGFELIGAHVEQPPLGRRILCFDYANAAEKTFATVYRHRDEVNLYFVTPCENGGFVLTADHKRAGVERDDYLAGGLVDAKPEPLLAVHTRRVERMKKGGRPPREDLSLEARVRAAEEWFRGHGVRETRVKNFYGLILSLMALYIVGSVLYLSIAKTTGVRPVKADAVQQEAVK